MSRSDLARWSGLSERHPLVGLFHRFGAVKRANQAFDRLSHLEGDDFVNAVFQALAIRLEVGQMDLDRIPNRRRLHLGVEPPFWAAGCIGIGQSKKFQQSAAGLSAWEWKTPWGAFLSLEEALVVMSDAASEGGRSAHIGLAGSVRSCG